MNNMEKMVFEEIKTKNGEINVRKYEKGKFLGKVPFYLNFYVIS